MTPIHFSYRVIFLHTSVRHIAMDNHTVREQVRLLAKQQLLEYLHEHQRTLTNRIRALECDIENIMIARINAALNIEAPRREANSNNRRQNRQRNS